ncbi:MAG: restriction endonuclease subunit S [Kiritimatiellia bacterium]|jgi:type I restriction enzyme S subunit
MNNTGFLKPTKLASVAEVIFSNVDKLSSPGEIQVRLCNYTDVYYNRRIDSRLQFKTATATPREIKRFHLLAGDVVITKDSESANDIAVPAYVAEDIPDLVCGYHLAILRPKNGILDGRFLSQLLQLHHTRQYFATLANGVTRFGLGTDAINKAQIRLPNVAIQRKIADILTLWDETLEKLDALIAAKERRKKALMQQLLTGRKRLKGFTGKWRIQELGAVVTPNSRPVPKPAKPFLAAGIRSHGRGVFLKPDFNPSEIALDELFQLRTNDLVVNITFAWEGALAIVPPEADGALVSHRFPTFQCEKNKAALGFIRHIIRTKRFVFECGLASPGGAGRNRVLSKNAFLNIAVSLPSFAEQTAIANILGTCDEELRLLRAQRDTIDQQKRGLMQRLLTGKVRVNSAETKTDNDKRGHTNNGNELGGARRRRACLATDCIR